jgi:rRNA-processing protein FCF1
LELDFEDLNEDIEENSNELKEINNIYLSLENNLETMQLKKPNQVYFELYRDARKKAKEAKKNAILAYLEAKNIKKTYMIENMDDSDSEFDAEIDEISESELEDF